MKRTVAFACIALALPGCALMKRRVEYRYVSTQCLTADQYQQLKAQEPPKIHDRLNGDEDHDIKIIAGSLLRVRVYADGLLEVLGGCTEADRKTAGDLLNDKVAGK